MTDPKPPQGEQPDDAAQGHAQGDGHGDGDSHPAYVTDLASMEHQVGEHVMTALGHDSTVAVLTTVLAGDDGQQRIVSFPMNTHQLSEVRRLLSHAPKRNAKRVRCIGFHCRIQEKDVGTDEADVEREDASDAEHQ